MDKTTCIESVRVRGLLNAIVIEEGEGGLQQVHAETKGRSFDGRR